MVFPYVRPRIRPDKLEAYLKWAEGAIKRMISAPGVIELRAYRGTAGTPQVVTTLEFADMSHWATWNSSEEAQKVYAELHTVAFNVTNELWGPSPVVPAPVRPGK